jgi:hypothetical protein
LRKLKLHSIAELVLYAVRNEIIHVQYPAVLHFPSPKGEPTRARATSGYEELSSVANGPADVARQSFN